MHILLLKPTAPADRLLHRHQNKRSTLAFRYEKVNKYIYRFRSAVQKKKKLGSATATFPSSILGIQMENICQSDNDIKTVIWVGGKKKKPNGFNFKNTQNISKWHKGCQSAEQMAEALSAYSTKTIGLTGWLSLERAISSEDAEREQRCPK